MMAMLLKDWKEGARENKTQRDSAADEREDRDEGMEVIIQLSIGVGNHMCEGEGRTRVTGQNGEGRRDERIKDRSEAMENKQLKCQIEF